jgi:predicted RNase H-like HicB family nuclease
MTYRQSITTYEYTYTCLFEPAMQGGFTVTSPALPGLVAYGATVQAARTAASEAIGEYLQRLQEHGLPFPVSEEAHRERRREPITVSILTV